MQKLVKANIYRQDFLKVNGKLVDRYNDCLKLLGFKPTKLSEFSVDGMGWSPEIAEEKGVENYLNNGEANPQGIIISPLQNDISIAQPFHSFDTELMKLVFTTHGQKINDITRDSAICLDFDQGIDAFIDPMDVLKYDKVFIQFRITNNMDKIQARQMALIEKFNTSNNFIDESIHKEILDSAIEHGDLRHRDFSLNELLFKPESFYTKAFGGVYVLRGFITPILVFEDKESYGEAIKDTIHDVLIYHIDQPELITKLKDHYIIECKLNYVVDTERYERIKKFMFFENLKEKEHPIKDILDDNILFKRYLNKVEVAVLKKVSGVELYLERLERSNQYKINDMVDPEMYVALHQPHSSLKPHDQDLIWRLLTRIAPKDVLHLFWYLKEDFYKKFKDWEPSFQDWVIEQIRNKIR
ncbi:DUF6638 family protein [Aegicerativicinus sediminis]|uniref:DUF6638 family protein n=1 Tax=Aegicerativicinus sediminis TaxID=2893202 RepID=UPI001E52698E|nr:DUF6638 family protein [Aegicerativicinus sediminis]